MKKLLTFLTISVLISSCGVQLGKLDESSVTLEGEVNIDRNGLVFDPNTGAIPFPNDILWASIGGNVTLQESTEYSDATNLLYRAVNALKIKGFSPNMFIAVPLINDFKITSLDGHYKLFDLTDLNLCIVANTGCSDIDETEKLTFLQDNSYLKFYPVKPLDAGHQYLFLLLDGIKDETGNSIIESTIYSYLESEKPLSDETLESLREKYAYLYDKVLPSLNPMLNRDTVLEMFTFTTANKTLAVSDFSMIKEALTNSTIVENLEDHISGLDYSSIANEYKSIESEALSFVGQVDTENNTFTTYLISENRTEKIPFVIFNGENYTDTVYIFMHGLGGNKTLAELLTSDISFPVVAFDLPWHGSRVLTEDNPYTDCNETVSGSCFLTENPGSDRLNFYQSILDLRAFANALKSGKLDIDRDGTPDTPSNVYFVGMSLGSIVGGPFVSFDSNIDKAVFNTGGANFAALLDTAKNSLITSLVGKLGVKRNTIEYFVALGLFQTLLDPADPANLMNSSISNKSILQTAYGDSIVSNISNKVFAKALGFDDYSYVNFGNPDISTGWYMFGNETAYVNHGFLLSADITYYPEVSEYLGDENYLIEAQKAARKQIESFFRN
ncbi:hypothetical protein [Desulfurobacterium atlanticum]|uniref:Virulence factor lipase N-terminal n=1 Tax=Desulfurobacterium atlanticum TaxID=240169 RepID=A0A238Y2E3_9BACT|nr:hypothetical protein [Desulfurobacterium atlanticum]SNR64479.1 virulence factor lipase N-terminal [Desulfurobacterium atlanticum]